MMNLLRICAPIVAVVGMSFPVLAKDWKPADGPLMTPWAKDVTPDKVLPEYPRPQMVRDRWMNLNGLWQMSFGKADDKPPVGKDLADQILVPFPVESALSGVMKRADRLWYRRTFEVPKDWKGQQTLLHFGAVDWESEVWVNGQNIGTHKGGYDPFSFDITSALKGEGPQELIVRVYDPTDDGPQPRGKQVKNPEGIYYTPITGIWQTVWLEPRPKDHIDGFRITTETDPARATIQGSFTTYSTTKYSLTVRADDPTVTAGTPAPGGLSGSPRSTAGSTSPDLRSRSTSANPSSGPPRRPTSTT